MLDTITNEYAMMFLNSFGGRLNRSSKLRFLGDKNPNAPTAEEPRLRAFFTPISRARYAIVGADDSGEYQELLGKSVTNYLASWRKRCDHTRINLVTDAIVNSMKALLKVNWYLRGYGLEVIQGQEPNSLMASYARKECK